jgi:hypothetical protein
VSDDDWHPRVEAERPWLYSDHSMIVGVQR